MRRMLEIGGLIAAVVLIGFGVAAVVMGYQGHSTVQSSLKQEQIVGSPDMTPAKIAAEAKAAGLTGVTLPTCSVANQSITTGSDARCFAQYMRIHALEATGGQTYAQMPRFATADGKGTNDPAAASKSPAGTPVDNPARQVWISETALSGALNSAYAAEQMSRFGVVVGVALLLSGLGFGILALAGALRNRDSMVTSHHPATAASTTPATV